MTKFRFGVSSKLLLAFTVFTVAVILAGLGSIFYINKMGDLFEGIYNENMISINSVNKTKGYIDDIVIDTYRYLGTQDPDDLQLIEEKMNSLSASIYQSFKESPDKYNHAIPLFDSLEITRKKAMDYHYSFNSQLAYELVNEDGQKNFIKLEKIIAEISDKEQDFALDRLKNGLDIKEGIIIYLIAVIIIRILLNSTIAFLVFRSITRPLIDLVKFITQLHKTSDFSQKITIQHKDEMGDAARAINGLADSLKEVITNISFVLKENSAGNFDPRITMPLVGDLERLKTSVNDNAQITHDTIARINHVMKYVSKSDFSQRVDISLKGELGSLKDNINNTIDTLQSTIENLHEEINDRVKAEQQLKEKSTQLIELSRHVGRADIATSTLHNVGNVLNSLTTSSHAISGCAEKLNTDDQDKLIALLKSHGTDLSAYLSDPDKSRLILSFIEKNNEMLKAAKEEFKSNNHRLKQHIIHITRIITSQQKHAKLSNLEEELNLEKTLNSAIDLSGINRDRIHLVIDSNIKSIPAFISDKDKVLQILTNLLNNAKHAINDCNREKGLISIDVVDYVDTFTISIEDNGHGVNPDIEKKLFSLGFTTRSNGHGFGLHYSALMASELGGKLELKNKGEGIGAIFCFNLPYDINNGKNHEK